MKPLLLRQHILEAFGNLSAALAVKVIVGLIGPSAGNTHPCAAQFLSQLNQPGIGGINGIVPLLKIAHVTPILNCREFLSAIHLCFRVSFPEGAAGYFGHLDVVGNQAFIDLAQSCQLTRVQVDNFFHTNFLLKLI